jgi:hypothetical protein
LTLDATLWARLAQLNATVAAAYSLALMGAVARWGRRSGKAGAAGGDGLLGTMISLGVALVLIVLVVGTAALFVDPVPHPALLAITGPWGWCATLLAAVSVVVWAGADGGARPADGLGLGLLAGADFLALGLASRDTGDWLTYHALLSPGRWRGACCPWSPGTTRGCGWRRWRRRPRGGGPLGDRRAGPGRAAGDPRLWLRPASSWWTVGALLAMVALAASWPSGRGGRGTSPRRASW